MQSIVLIATKSTTTLLSRRLAAVLFYLASISTSWRFPERSALSAEAELLLYLLVTEFMTLNPDDKYMNPRPVPEAKTSQAHDENWTVSFERLGPALDFVLTSCDFSQPDSCMVSSSSYVFSIYYRSPSSQVGLQSTPQYLYVSY